MNNDGPPFFRGAFEQHHGGAGSLGWIIFALQLLMLAALAVLLVRAFAWRPRRRAQAAPAAGDPLELVRYRYASGELTRDEYLQASRDLGGEPDAPTEELPQS
jgi:uncharacterized membrane protein